MSDRAGLYEEADLAAELTQLGFRKTTVGTDTSNWVCTSNERVLAVPLSPTGYYPDWLWDEIIRTAERVRLLPPVAKPN